MRASHGFKHIAHIILCYCAQALSASIVSMNRGRFPVPKRGPLLDENPEILPLRWKRPLPRWRHFSSIETSIMANGVVWSRIQWIKKWWLESESLQVKSSPLMLTSNQANISIASSYARPIGIQNNRVKIIFLFGNHLTHRSGNTAANAS